jgi:anti-anti-sigma regulatory factor
MHGRRPRRLLVDLGRLGFLGLQGIAVFERLRRHALAAGTDVGLVALSPAGRRALQFAGVLPAFDRYPDVASALAAAAQAPAVAQGAGRQ